MGRAWNIGNTTVRNPNRIEIALKVFKDEGFSGNAKGVERESSLHQVLKNSGILEFSGQPDSWNGRKWRAAFYQLGFIANDTYKVNGQVVSVVELFSRLKIKKVSLPYQLTTAGEALLSQAGDSSIPAIDDIYLRQFSCYEIPNALEPRFEGGKMKPFILLLEILIKLRDNGLVGLSKDEIGIFLQKFQDHSADLSDLIVSQLLDYRKRLEGRSRKEQKVICKEYLERASLEMKVSSATVKDYSDTTIRYFSLAGLFIKIDNRIELNDSKVDIVRSLLSNGPNFVYDQNPLEYFTYFYNNTYPIPTDDRSHALREIDFLIKSLGDSNAQVLIEVKNLNRQSKIEEIQKFRYRLIEYANWEKEEDYAKKQEEEHNVSEILTYLKSLNGLNTHLIIEDRPAYFEWAVWRAFLSIDGIVSKIHDSRRFQLDNNFFPRNTAPGGGSDLILEFDTYVLAVEVTLTKSHRQMAAESEPVRRHVVNYKEIFKNKEVYCLFVAPSLDNNLVESFKSGLWYSEEEEIGIDIIPMTLGGFIEWFETFASAKFTNEQFRSLLEAILRKRNLRTPQWKAYITEQIIKWKNSILDK